MNRPSASNSERAFHDCLGTLRPRHQDQQVIKFVLRDDSIFVDKLLVQAPAPRWVKLVVATLSPPRSEAAYFFSGVFFASSSIFLRYLAGSLLKSLRQDLQQSLMVWPS